MKIIRESIDRFFDYDFHLETRTIYIGDSDDGDGVGPKMAEKVIKGLHFLETHDSAKPIIIILNSGGGSVFDGFAIYDAIKASPCKITIRAYGSCMSMATVILQAADERVLAPNITFMIHDGTDYVSDVSPKSFKAWSENSIRLRDKMYEIYAERSGQKSSFWEKRCSHDYIISAQEAVDLGLADSIMAVRIVAK